MAFSYPASPLPCVAITITAAERYGIMRNRVLILALVVCVVFALIAAVAPYRMRAEDAKPDKPDLIAPTDKETCLGCHADKVDGKHLAASAHGALNCQDCHRGVNQYPHPAKAIARKPSCRTCHAAQAAALTGSVHAHAANGKGPDCNTCHGKSPHEIPKMLSLAPRLKDASCRGCHREVATALTASAHGHGGASGNAPGCLSCHGDNPHAIAPPGKSMGEGGDAACRRCHQDASVTLMASVHGRASTRVPGAKLSCLSCHGANPHAVSKPGQAGGAKPSSALCANCHQKIADTLAHSAHGQAGGTPAKALDCFACHGSNLHSVRMPAKLTQEDKALLCESCHADAAKALAASAHGHVGLPAGKRPNCLSCHGDDMHALTPRAKLEEHRLDFACKKCHPDTARKLALSVHGDANARFTKESGCLACHGGVAHKVLPLAKLDRTQQERACKSCHASLSQTLKNSVHDRPDKQPGDHPTCVYCHGGNPHDIAPPAHLSSAQRAELCGSCHSDAARMARYGLTTAAFDSYRQTFHGKALLRFGNTKVANCTDCHGLHGVLAPNDPASPTNPAHVAATCAKCHKDAKLNFALSGANHLRMQIDRSPFLRVEEFLFRLLIFGSMAFLTGLVLLDLRRKVFAPDSRPECGRFVATLIALSFFALIAGIVLAFLGVPNAWWCWLVAIAAMIAAVAIFQHTRRRHSPKKEKLYPRLSRFQRVQHVVLASCFTVLVLTGFPLRFADVGWTHYALLLFGGFDGARIAHRVAGVTMLVNFGVHVCYLLYRWKQEKFSFASMTMFPRVKDVYDLFDTVRYGLGITNTPPQFDRFQFREKFDYFADMWGTFVMGLTGLILWFPTVIGNHLPDLAFGVSYIAHSYEGLLAMMAIIVWHFYNAHFNPDAFPMNPTWYSGMMTEAEMAREHPLEKARIDAADAARRSVVVEE